MGGKELEAVRKSGLTEEGSRLPNVKRGFMQNKAKTSRALQEVTCFVKVVWFFVVCFSTSDAF